MDNIYPPMLSTVCHYWLLYRYVRNVVASSFRPVPHIGGPVFVQSMHVVEDNYFNYINLQKHIKNNKIKCK